MVSFCPNLFLALGFSPEPERISEGGLRVWKTWGGFAGKTTWNENGLGFVLVEFLVKPAIFTVSLEDFAGAIYHFKAFDIY